MMSQCNSHCEVTNLACDTCCLQVKIFLLLFCLEIDGDNKEGGVGGLGGVQGGWGGWVIYSSFLLIIISVFIFSFFLSIP